MSSSPVTGSPVAYIVDAVRTPVGKRGGGLSSVHPADLGAHSIKALMERTGVDPNAVDDVVFGNVDSVGPQAGCIARTCWLAAGLPEHVPGTTIDRQCGSAQQAVHFAAQAVMSGTMDLVVAGGVQNMSMIPISSAMTAGQALGFDDPFTGSPGWTTRYGTGEVSQFVGAEMMVDKWNLSREEMEEFAIESHNRALRARADAALAVGMLDTLSDCGTCMRDVTACPSLSLIAACTLPFELSPAGDAAALIRQGGTWATGGDPDGIEAALATLGLAATAGTLVTAGSSLSIKGAATTLRTTSAPIRPTSGENRPAQRSIAPSAAASAAGSAGRVASPGQSARASASVIPAPSPWPAAAAETQARTCRAPASATTAKGWPGSERTRRMARSLASRGSHTTAIRRARIPRFPGLFLLCSNTCRAGGKGRRALTGRCRVVRVRVEPRGRAGWTIWRCSSICIAAVRGRGRAAPRRRALR